MRFNYFLIIISLFINVQVNAQKSRIFSDERYFAGGIYLGGNLSQIDGDYRGGFEKLGLRSGASLYYRIPNYNWIFQFELAYSEKGSRANTIVDNGLGPYFEKYRAYANYVQAPLILNYYYKEKYLFGVGLAYNAFINSKEWIINMYGTGNFDPSIYKFQRHTFDYVLQAGWQFSSAFIVSMRYEYGLNPMRLWKNTVQGLASSNQYNNTVTIGLSYVF